MDGDLFLSFDGNLINDGFFRPPDGQKPLFSQHGRFFRDPIEMAIVFSSSVT